jgi:hypothetical protein
MFWAQFHCHVGYLSSCACIGFWRIHFANCTWYLEIACEQWVWLGALCSGEFICFVWFWLIDESYWLCVFCMFVYAYSQTVSRLWTEVIHKIFCILVKSHFAMKECLWKLCFRHCNVQLVGCTNRSLLWLLATIACLCSPVVECPRILHVGFRYIPKICLLI